MRRKIAKKILALFALFGALAAPVNSSHFFDSSAFSQQQLFEHEAINYQLADPSDAISALQKRLDKGESKLAYSEDNGGYLQSVLKLLHVPISSQGLVFSKTSLQLFRISPSNPRAIYFNDDVYIGWVRGGEVLEISTTDPNLGAVFYVLEQKADATPRFVRSMECLQCHSSRNTKDVPGHLVRSIFPDVSGYGIAPMGSRVTDHSSPLKERWGGWYVTGSHGNLRHLGNLIFNAREKPDEIERTEGLNLLSLAKKVNLTGYASINSDIVALMTLEHQTQMHNLIARLNYETRIALQQQAAINEALKIPNDELRDSTRRRIENAGNELLKYLLFVGEAKLNAQIKGTTNFAKEFSAPGIKDKKGRSLRDFDLQRRLFKFPCSYLIYSESFDALPPVALEFVYHKLWLILMGQDGDKTFEPLSTPDRQAILEILRETKQNLPNYFQAKKLPVGNEKSFVK
jgi:hypothetical protein